MLNFSTLRLEFRPIRIRIHNNTNKKKYENCKNSLLDHSLDDGDVAVLVCNHELGGPHPILILQVDVGSLPQQQVHDLKKSKILKQCLVKVKISRRTREDGECITHIQY